MTASRVSALALGCILLCACARSGLSDDPPPAQRLGAVPGAPSRPSVIEGDAQLTVSWLPPVDPGGAPISGYRVEWFGGSRAVGAEQTTLVVSGLTNGLAYAVVVSATNAFGTGPASEPSPTASPGAAPSPPTMTSAIGGSGQAIVSWAAADPRGRPVTVYTVTASNGRRLTARDTRATFTGLEPGQYTFSVTATNALGTSAPSAPSNEVTVTVRLPGPPLGVLGKVTGTGALVQWSAPRTGGAPTGYVVRALPGGPSATTGGATEATIAGLTPGLSYRFRVSATNQAGEGPPSLASAPLMFAQGTSACPGATFLGGPPDPAALPDPRAVASGDLDSDGKLDLVVIDSTTVFLVRGVGDGTFAPRVPLATVADASAVAIAHLNGDTFADVVVTSNSSGVTVFAGDGLGSLGAPANYPAVGGARLVAISRLDSNASLDLALVHDVAGTVSILLNDGAGVFTSAGSHAVGSAPSSIATADFNGDGVRDLAVPNGSGELNLLLGNGDGSFRRQLAQGLGPAALQSLTAADFDGDGDADLVGASESSAGAFVLLGNGDATFSGASLPNSAYGGFVTSADFDGNGTLDVVLLRPSQHLVTSYLGDGAGSFQAHQVLSPGSWPVWATAGDFNGDGRADVVTANRGPLGTTAPYGSLSLLLATAGGFAAPRTTTLGPLYLQAIVAEDFNVDGKVDLAATQQESPGGYQLKILLGTGTGEFQAPVVAATLSEVGDMRPGDFNRDGVPDLAISDLLNGDVVIFLGLGDGGFQRAGRYMGFGARPVGVAVDDFNGDQVLDLATATEAYFGVDIYLGHEDGTFDPTRRLIVGNQPQAVVTADFNRDGRVDVASANEGSESVSVLLGDGAGAFQLRRDKWVGAQPRALATTDLNQDLLPDLLVANAGSRSLTVLLGGGTGGFASSVTLPLETTPTDVTAADLTLDGHPDVLVTLVNSRVLLFRGRGDGTLAAPVSFGVPGAAQALAVGQFDGDGRPDVAILSGTGTVLLRNTCAP